MKNLLLFLLLSALPAISNAQTEGMVATQKKLKVVFQLTTNDTTVQKSLIKQLGHFLIAAPNARLEVVCHNNGISLLQTATAKQADKIRELKAKGVDFVACENTMRDRKIKKEDLLPDIRTVPSGVVEVALKQNKRWSYIRAGL